MNDLDTLRPEVAEAIRLFGAVIEELGLHDDYESALHVLCAELLRLTDENARLLAANRDAMDHFEQMQAELAALKARIAEAPAVSLVYGQGDMLSVLSAENADDWAGKQVRLLVVEE